MNSVEGDLVKLALAGEFDVIVHGCNCQCVMGAGVAKAIRNTFPQAYQADLATPKGDRNKLGTISYASVDRGGSELVIVNAYTQFHWRGDGVLVDYAAVRTAFAAIKATFAGRRIGYPMIGAGLARGDWRTLARIIDEELGGEDHTVVKFTG